MCDHCGCREYGPIAELTADHERILELAWRVAESDRDGTDGSDGTDGTDPIAVARAELAALLAVHAEKEELGLYPLLAATGDLATPQRDALEAEHRDVHEILAHGTFDRRDFFALAAHIEEEEVELFPFAMFGFEDEEWDAMARAHHDALHHAGVAHDHDDRPTSGHQHLRLVTADAAG